MDASLWPVSVINTHMALGRKKVPCPCCSVSVHDPRGCVLTQSHGWVLLPHDLVQFSEGSTMKGFSSSLPKWTESQLERSAGQMPPSVHFCVTFSRRWLASLVSPEEGERVPTRQKLQSPRQGDWKRTCSLAVPHSRNHC